MKIMMGLGASQTGASSPTWSSRSMQPLSEESPRIPTAANETASSGLASAAANETASTGIASAAAKLKTFANNIMTIETAPYSAAQQEGLLKFVLCSLMWTAILSSALSSVTLQRMCE